MDNSRVCGETMGAGDYGTAEIVQIEGREGEGVAGLLNAEELRSKIYRC